MAIDPEADSGGSAAGRAYREQLAREGTTLEAPPSDMAPLTGLGDLGPNPNGSEARVAERRKVIGRARLTFGGNQVANGKMVDISATGACVLMEDMQPSKKVAMLECDIFHNGKRHTFGLQVVTVYGVLVSGKGFKIGVQFGPRSPVVAKILDELLR